MLRLAHPVITDEEIEAVTEVLRSGRLSGFSARPDDTFYGGEKVREFEKAFAEKFGVKHAIAFNSGTAALHASVVACGVEPGDEVIVSPYTFTASASCVLHAGAKPVFIDIEPNYFCMDGGYGKLTPRLTDKTKAIIPVHLCGHPAFMGAIGRPRVMRPHIKIIEDSCQAIGAKYINSYTGTIGDCGVFSFQNTKPIVTGEGGMLVTNDDEIYEKACLVRNHGEALGSDVLGWNYRMGEMEAALGIVQLGKLDFLNDRRIELCNYMTEQLSKIDGLTPPAVMALCKHTYYTYAIKYDADKIGMSRSEFAKRLKDKGIYFGEGYVKPLHLLPIYGGKEGDCPVAERMWKEELLVTDIFRYPMTMEDAHKIATEIQLSALSQ